MKILLHYPDWHNRWEQYIIEALNGYDLTVSHEKALDKVAEQSADKDILISMWATNVVGMWTKTFPEKKIITYCRRFELWEPTMVLDIAWPQIDKVIFVSEWCMEVATMILTNNKLGLPKSMTLIPNGIDMSQFTVRKQKPGTKKLALVCSMKEVKNVPLALQIMVELPKEYTLHQIGIPFSSQHTGQIVSYAYGLGLEDRVEFGGYIKKDKVTDWLADKDYILSTSINEGNPNNVIEAMAMGIKPIIHNWPGARQQFPEDLVFDRVSGAVDLITGQSYEPNSYRNWVEGRFGLKNFELFRKAVDEVANG